MTYGKTTKNPLIRMSSSQTMHTSLNNSTVALDAEAGNIITPEQQHRNNGLDAGDRLLFNQSQWPRYSDITPHDSSNQPAK
jgi:hypothetical protein